MKRQEWHESKVFEEIIIKLQSRIKGYLIRKKIFDRCSYFHRNLEKIIAIQAWWRGIAQRKRYLKLLRAQRKRENAILHENRLLNTKARGMDDILRQYRKQVSFEFHFCGFIF